MNLKLAGLALLCIVAAIGGWLLFRGSPTGAASGPEATDSAEAATTPQPDTPPAPAVDQAPATPPEGTEARGPIGPVVAGPLRLTPPTPVRTPSDRSRMLQLPDGSFVPALNGAIDPPAISWPSDKPWSPIVGREIDTVGKEWYVHADGTKTITDMVWRSDLGRKDGFTGVNHPMAPGTMIDGAGAPIVPGGAKPTPDGRVGPRKM